MNEVLRTIVENEESYRFSANRAPVGNIRSCAAGLPCRIFPTGARLIVIPDMNALD